LDKQSPIRQECGSRPACVRARQSAHPMPLLVLLNGPPCAGKTHLRRYIAETFRVPAMSKDILKESLYETLGWSDRAWSRKLGQAAVMLLFEYAASLLSQNQACLLENNFVADRAQRDLEALRAKVQFKAIQIFVWAQPEILHSRFRHRARCAVRHPGHLDQILQHEYSAASMPQSQMRPIETGGPVLRLETTHLDAALAADHRVRVKEWLRGMGLPCKNDV